MMITDSSACPGLLAFAGYPQVAPPDDREGTREKEAVVSPLKQLIQLTQSNDRLMAELKRARRRLRQALEYASDPRSGGDLAITLVVHTKENHTRVLNQLRANRLKALDLLARLSNER